jgi:hypothetical protein
LTSADEVLKVCKAHNTKMLQALQYENDGEICVVTGPITKPRQADKEVCIMMQVILYSFLWSLGYPVICHGLVSASHLNGKVGGLRDLHNNTGEMQLPVHFEKKPEAIIGKAGASLNSI